MAQIKAESPGTKVLMYTTAVDVAKDCDLASEELTCQTGITMYDVNTNDSSWILTRRERQPDRQRSLPVLLRRRCRLGDLPQQVGQPRDESGEDAGLRRCLDRQRSRQLRGQTGGVVPAKYPTQSAWRTAMAGFVAAVGPALKAQGLYVGGQAFGWDDSGGADNNDGSYDVGWWQQLAPNLSALFCEYFEQNPNN